MELTPRDDEQTHEAAPRRRPSRVRFEPTEIGSRRAREVGTLRDAVIAASRRCALAEAERARAFALLQEHAIVNSSSDAEISLTLHSRAAECAAAMGISERSVLGQMAESHTLVSAYPAVIAAVEEGKITFQHARVVVAEGSSVDHRLRETYEARCLEIAVQVSAGRLRAGATQIVQELQPRGLDERHAIAASQRCVWVRELPDGMAELGAILPAPLAYGNRDRVQNIAKALKREVASEEAAWAGAVAPIPESVAFSSPTVAEAIGLTIAPPTGPRAARAREERTLGTYRADVFAELLLTGVLGNADGTTTAQRVAPDIRASISIIFPVGGTATLEGYGPIDSPTARQLAAVAPGWDAITIDSDGQVLSTDRRQPTEAMKRVLRTRDQHCRFPGCVVPTRSCEIDHTIEWATGGPTAVSNLGHLCPKHHLLKHPDLAHQIQWRVRQDAGGVFVWTSPTGAEYTDRPDGALRAQTGVTDAAAASTTCGPEVRRRWA